MAESKTILALRALDAAPDKRLPFADFRRASGVTTRAYYPFVARLLERSLIAEYGDLSSSKGYTLTFAGMRALKAEGR